MLDPTTPTEAGLERSANSSVEATSSELEDTRELDVLLAIAESVDD